MRLKNTLICAVLLIASVTATAARISGVVTDSQSGDPLPGANVSIEGTSLGAATDLEGEYVISNVPPGNYTLNVTFIGYENMSRNVRVEAKRDKTENFQLIYKIIEGEEITITAQAEGQMSAINQQVRSNTIKNVVSSERIRELPDNNAAESVGRLPGVAVRRSGGEGTRVNIRGLSPKFSAITVNGERIPATGQGRNVFTIKTGGGGTRSAGVDDRSVDLSMISSEAIGGIELVKALTPDRDADAIGGTVDFVTSKAPAGRRVRLNALGGYTGYHESFNNFRGNASFSDRFFDNRLGVLVSGGMHRADRSRDNQDVSWVWLGGAVDLNRLQLNDTIEQRDRYNMNLNMDYTIGNTEILFNSMYARTNRDIKNRSLRLGIRVNSGDYSANWRKPEIYFYSGNLRFNHTTSFAKIDWGVNYVTTVDNNDFNYGYGFSDDNPFQNFNFVEEEGPLAASNIATINLQAHGGAPWGGGETTREDNNWSAQFNAQKDFSLSDQISGYFKLGSKLRIKDRSRNSWGLKGNGGLFHKRYLENNPEHVSNLGTDMSMEHFLGAYDPLPFFNGDHPFPISLDAELPYHLFQEYRTVWRDRLVNGLGDYTAQENIYAGYAMTELNLTKRVTMLGGVRYEQSDNKYDAFFRWDVHEEYDDTSLNQISGSFNDTTSTQNYSNWLPMLHLKFALLQDAYSNNGLDLRLAATKSLTRPDFIKVTPSTSRSNSSFLLERSNPNLMPTEAWNFDAFLTAYTSKFGLFTVGGFYKELSNVDFLFAREANVEVDGEEWKGFTIVEPQNSDELTKVWGFEVELQTNFNYLPGLLSGIVLYGNYSIIKSEVKYPYNKKEYDPETFRVITTLTTRTGRLPGQAEELFNIALGYDMGRFSGRVSYYFQGSSLDWLGENEEMDGYVDDYARIDFSSNFRLTDRLTAILNLNNINNRHDRSFLGVDKRVAGETIYGMQGEFGLRFDF